MEQITQKYIKYFYITLAVMVLFRLFVTIYQMLTVNFQYELLFSIVLCIVNILLLITGVKHNIKQQFTECKTDAKILRYTFGLLVGINMIIHFETAFDWSILTDHLLIISTIEIVLSHRIRTIEYLEKLANQRIGKTNISPRKEEK